MAGLRIALLEMLADVAVGQPPPLRAERLAHALVQIGHIADSAELFRATREELILEVAELLPLGVSGDLSPRAALRAYCGLAARAFADPRYVELVGSIVRDGWSAPWLIDAYQRHIRVLATRSLETCLQGLRPDTATGADIRRAALNLIASIESVAVSTRLLSGINRSDCDIPHCTPDLIDGFMARVCADRRSHLDAGIRQRSRVISGRRRRCANRRHPKRERRAEARLSVVQVVRFD